MLLELVTAAEPLTRPGVPVTAMRRRRLRAAVVTVLHAGGHPAPPSLITTNAQALEALEMLLRRCRELGVPWTEIVSRVNGD